MNRDIIPLILIAIGLLIMSYVCYKFWVAGISGYFEEEKECEK